MRTKISWLQLGIFAVALAAAGCGGGASTGQVITPLPGMLSIYNSNVDFGDVAVGATETLEVTLSNTGGSSLTLQQNSISGAGFSASGVGSASLTLTPGQYVTLP